MSRCEHDLDIVSCADCRPRPGQAQATAGGDPGSWFIAGFPGTCSGCGQDIVPGDEIRADGGGSWERCECCGPLGDFGFPRVLRAARLAGWGPS